MLSFPAWPVPSYPQLCVSSAKPIPTLEGLHIGWARGALSVLPSACPGLSSWSQPSREIREEVEGGKEDTKEE